MQAIVEQFRQVLECQAVLFVPGCADASLRHPLLDFLPASVLSEWRCVSITSGKKDPQGIWIEEPVRALCDLAIQDGRMQILKGGSLCVDRWRLKSVAALPLEYSAGTLGVFLLADERPERFGAGEERLAYTYLSMYLGDLVQTFRERARLLLGDERNRMWLGSEPDWFIKDEFVSIVRHELRMPLSIIKGYAGLLQVYGGTNDRQTAALTADQQQHYLAAIMEQTDLLEVLVNDLFDASSIQRGKLALHPRVVDVGTFCRQLIQSGQMRADQLQPGKYHLECRLPSNLPSLWVDANRLRQVLMNVVENAIKFSPDGGLITLEVGLLKVYDGRVRAPGGRQVSTCVRFVVRDQGIGIPAQHFAQLFQPFARLEQPGSARVAGMGLGLYITRKLVEAMGGSIDLQSCEGNGTTITITLPAVNPGEVIALDPIDQVSRMPTG